MTEYDIGKHGQYASSPYSMPWPAWKQVALRVYESIGRDNISIVSAGVAFYGFLALFPALAAMVMLYGLIWDPSDVQRQLSQYAGLLPTSAFEIVTDRLKQITSAGSTKLSFGFIFSLGFALWSATRGTQGLMVAMNISYEEIDRRSVVWFYALSIFFTLCAIIFFILSLALIAAIPAGVHLLQLGPALSAILLWSRWPVLAILMVVAVAALYRYGPHRRPARIEWLTPGAILASALWLLLSGGFSFYVEHFGNYGETFGTLTAVVVLLMWFYLSAYVVCIGAELNAELELQTYRDSTISPHHRRGLRGAYVADHTAWDRPHRRRRGD